MKEENTLGFTNGTTTSGFVFFSNYLEALHKILEESLFSERSDPFLKRTVVAPSKEMGEWVRLRLAENKKIACGFEIVSLHHVIQTLTAARFPSWGEVFLRILEAIPMHSTDPLWSPLLHYLKGRERRLLLLAKKLTSLFLQYGIYGGKRCRAWEKHPQNWQEALWKKVFAPGDYPLNHEPLNSLPAIHLFGFTHIPPLYLHFLSKNASLSFYQLSPSQEYGGDSELPLLQTGGLIGRKMQESYAESGLQTIDYYIDPPASTQLEKIQHALLNHLPFPSPSASDDSIQIHRASHPHREVQILYNLLKSLAVEPKEVLVFAPDLTPYLPAIQAIFGDSLPYRLTGVPLLTRDPTLQALFLLLNLEEKRWSAAALWELFENPLFRENLHWEPEAFDWIHRWIFSSKIQWGYNLEHRNRLLKHSLTNLEEPRGTWVEGIGQLLEELALPQDPPSLSFTEGGILEKFATLLERLYTSLSFFFGERETKRPFNSWIKALKALTQEYLGSFDWGIALPSSELEISFPSCYFLIQEILSAEEKGENGHDLQTIRFSPFSLSRTTPAKVIALLGMSQEAFPKKDSLLSLDLVQEAPSRESLDRSLFLETLLSAREKLIFLYSGDEGPSPVISELAPHIPPPIHHPVTSYDPLYFSSDLKNFSETDFLLALTLQLPLKTFPLKIPPQKLPEGTMTVSIKDFLNLLRYPLIRASQDDLPYEEKLTYSPLQKSVMLKQALQGSLPSFQTKGDFPLGIFGKIAFNTLSKEVAQIQTLSPSLKTYELYAHRQDKEEIEPGLFRLPAPRLALSAQTEVVFEGTIPYISNHSLLILQKKGIKGAVWGWPLFLLLSLIEQPETLIFARDGTTKSRFFEDPQPLLEPLIRYYFQFQGGVPSLLLPEWIEALVKNDLSLLEKSYDPQRHPILPDFGAILEEWAPLAKQLYGEMIDAWF